MKKKLLFAALVLVSLCSTYSLSAGTGGIKLIEFGIKAGINSQNLDVVNKKTVQDFVSSDNKLGMHFGLQSRINLLAIFVQPELVYTFNKYDMSLEQNALNYTSKVKVQTIDLPVMVGFKLLFLRAYAGPVFNLMTDTNNSSPKDLAMGVTFDKSAMSFAAGLGLDIKNITFDVRYAGEFKSPRQIIQAGSQQAFSVKTRANNWQFSLGYMF